MAGYKELKRGDHEKPGSEFTAVIGFKNEQLAFVQHYGIEWGAWLDEPLSPTNYIWFLGTYKTRERAEEVMLNIVKACKEPRLFGL